MAFRNEWRREHVSSLQLLNKLCISEQTPVHETLVLSSGTSLILKLRDLNQWKNRVAIL